MSDSILKTMINIRFQIGDIPRKYFENHNYSIYTKTSSTNLVTSADKELQKVIISKCSWNDCKKP